MAASKWLNQPRGEGQNFTRDGFNSDAYNNLSCVELFAGCGGMAKGLEQAGFRHVCMVEFNPTACETLRTNWGVEQHGERALVLEQDVRTIDWGGGGATDLVAGGPPCQPFSRGGLAAGEDDPRDMWPEAVRAVRELQPQAFIFENVKGLLRPAFHEYLTRITRSLERGGNDDVAGPSVYTVAVISVNAADYGAPQKRERVLVAGVRNGCGTLAPFPVRTHSIQRLVWEKWISGTYWHRHNLPLPEHGPTSRIEQSVLRDLKRTGVEPDELPWRTCRDAFAGLGAPMLGTSTFQHDLRSGAKVYPGHEGSPIDEPAKALKAGAHGVPGGENMLVDNTGLVRYFTLREAARLQGMPDAFSPSGSWSQAMRQFGNAVPVQLAETAGRWIRECLASK